MSVPTAIDRDEVHELPSVPLDKETEDGGGQRRSLRR
jgi:hypothetical protein